MNATIEHYQNEYKQHCDLVQDPIWLRKARDIAWQAFEEAGMPTKKVEQWKYNRLADIQKISFKTVSGALSSCQSNESLLPELDAYRIELLDGLLDEAQSDLEALSQWMQISRIENADKKESVLLKSVPNQTASSQAFSHLNTAFFNRGLVLALAKGLVLDKPLLIVQRFSAAASAAAVYSKSIIRMAPGSQMTLIEAFVGQSSKPHLLNATVAIELEESAILKQIKLQSNGQDDYHLVNTNVHQAKNSQYHLLSFAMGGKTARNDVRVLLNADGAQTKLQGLYLLAKEDEADHHLLVEHRAPNCQSLQNFKAILQDKSHGIFNGKVIVHPGADGTDAQQSNHNLLLSTQAEMDTKPELEIYADDVKCAHGATLGSLDEDALFFLCSRGISREDAKRLLIAAFADEIIETLPEEVLKAALRDYVKKRLNHEDMFL